MESGYRNISKRNVCEEGMEIIHTLDEETVKKLKLLSTKHEEWILEFDESSNMQFSLIKVPYSLARTTVDERRLVFEITADINQLKITIRTHGKPLTLEEFSRSAITFNTVETVIRFVDSVSLCLGSVVNVVSKDSSDTKLNHAVCGAVIISMTANEKEEVRLVSTSCLVITSGTRACKNCCHAAKLWRKREARRKMKRGEIHKKCNIRYLGRAGLEEKMYKQRKELRNDSVREKRLLDEMIEFSESDSTDLMKIMEDIESKNVPSDMALLWEMQTKQLASKSPAGYRWHPRYIYRVYKKPAKN